MLSAAVRERCSMKVCSILAEAQRGRRVTTHAAQTASASSPLPQVAVIGGGMAGLACAKSLTQHGVRVTLVEQGRGLGGRVCTRRAQAGQQTLTFDHGCQYITAKHPSTLQLLEELLEAGVIARWGQGGRLGDIQAHPDSGQLELGSFSPYPDSKAMYVGVPTNSAVGRHLAASCGPGLSVMTAMAAEQLVPAVRDSNSSASNSTAGGAAGWQLRLRPTAQDTSDTLRRQVAELEQQQFDLVVTALSAKSTLRLIQAHSPTISKAAASIRSNVCWALMVALKEPTGLPFDGALVSGSSSIAWVARDSSKPGRAAPAAGTGEAWVVHAAPEWSNQRQDMPQEQVAQELLQAFFQLFPQPPGNSGSAGRPITSSSSGCASSAVLHCEAHRWHNAYPLNPRVPEPLPGLPQLQGACLMDPGLRLVCAGDWCLGPRAGDAYVTGLEAATACLKLLGGGSTT